MISSLVCLVKKVKSRLSRLNSPASKPSSSSRPRSGLRSGLPMLLGVTALVASRPGTGAYVRSAESAAGCRPDSPYAARSFRTLNDFGHGQNDSSLRIHDALTLGYATHLKSSPKALLLSTRSAPVR